MMVSHWSSSHLLGGEGPPKHRIQWINICLGQVGMPRYLPREIASLTQPLVTDSGSVAPLGCCAVLWCKDSGISLGELQGTLMDSDTPSAAPHMNVPWMWPSWGGRFYIWGGLCKGGWTFTLSDQRLCYSPKTLPLWFGGNVCKPGLFLGLR